MLHDSKDSSKRDVLTADSAYRCHGRVAHRYILVATAVRPTRPTPYPAESIEDGPTDTLGRRIIHWYGVPNMWCVGVWKGIR